VAGRVDTEAVAKFVEALPELCGEWEEHLSDFGEALPHVFFGDVSRFVTRIVGTDDADVLARVCDALERLAAHDDESVVNLIHVSFIENLMWGDETEQAALRQLERCCGPALRARIREFAEWSSQLPERDS
jgi:hypothetical protein